MPVLNVEKVVSRLPDNPDPDTVYFVRAGNGFDMYVSDATGAIAHPLNPGEGAESSSTRALTQSLTAPPEVRDIDAWSIEAAATSRHVSGSVASFEATWWDGVIETVPASGGSATLSRAVDQPVGGEVSATVRALDDIGNASNPDTVTASVVATLPPAGPINISAPTQTGKNSTFQVSLTGATDPGGGPVTYEVTDTGTFVFSKTTGITEGELIDVTAPDVADDTAITFTVRAVDDKGGTSPTYSKTVTVLAAQVVGVEMTTTGGPGGVWNHIDEAGNAIATPTKSWFDAHPVWGGMQDVVVDGQQMVEIPKFYYKVGTSSSGNPARWISDQPLAGFTVMSAFEISSGEASAFQVGKYQASESGGKLQSVPGVKPLVSTTLTDFIAKAMARNAAGVAGFRLWHYDMWLAVQWLYLVENATMDSQAKTGEGRVNASSAASVDAADVAQATYRGIVGLWGNVWQWMDGVRTNGNVIERRDYDAAGWSTTGENAPGGSSSGSTQYPITFRLTGDEQFIADTFSTSNDNTATLPDYRLWRTGEPHYPFVGGYWSSGAGAGLWYVHCYYSASNAYSRFGGRLARIVS